VSVKVNEEHRIYGIVLVIAVIGLFISFAILHAASIVLNRIDKTAAPDMPGAMDFFNWLYAQGVGLIRPLMP
jgi:hypothetical protein